MCRKRIHYWCAAISIQDVAGCHWDTSGPPYSSPGTPTPVMSSGRYQAALDAGAAEAIVNTFAPDG
jgi:hypothetical protein